MTTKQNQGALKFYSFAHTTILTLTRHTFVQFFATTDLAGPGRSAARCFATFIEHSPQTSSVALALYSSGAHLACVATCK